MKIANQLLTTLGRKFPSRYREVPHPVNTDSIMLKQFAILKKHVYLQSFVTGEGHDYVHSHSWKFGTMAIGLSGQVEDFNLGTGKTTVVKAPYVRYMPKDILHNTNNPKDHLSIFIGFGKKDDALKGYVKAEKTPWEEHIKKFVKRL